MIKKLFAIAALSMSAMCAFAWSQKGHDVTAYIAEQHLTPATKTAVDSLLHGKSMVYWANWLDNASHTPEYAYSLTWHYKNINEGVPYEEMGNHPKGNIEQASYKMIEILTDPNSTPEESTLALKMLIHFIGDMHQPMHLGRQTDLGGNKRKVRYFNRDTNLHTVWDESIVSSGHKWSYTEWQQQIDRATPEEEQVIIQGTITDWCKQTHGVAQQVYEDTPEGTKISYDYVAKWTPVVEDQFLKGGLRLAHVLNSIFDPEYQK